MKILINTSNLYVGGGLQVALSYINELNHLYDNHEFHVFLSLAVSRQINQDIFTHHFKFYVIEQSPASLKTRKKVIAQLSQLENWINPDIVFTVFGPSYWRPSAKHILGFADGWVYNPHSVAYDRLSFTKRMKMRLYSKYKAYHIKKDADYFVVESNDARDKVFAVIGINIKRIFVVGNICSSVFYDNSFQQTSNQFYIPLPETDKENEFKLVYIAHNYPHKNIFVINSLLKHLQGYNIIFILTLDNKSFKSLFPKGNDNIINLGVIPQKSCPSVYYQCDALFCPTLLETFSAAYPEAMKMNLPILTSNYSFATDICGDAALYFDPLSPSDIANKIKQLVDSKKLQKRLTQRGRDRLEEFGTARSRAEKYVALCEHILNLNLVREM